MVGKKADYAVFNTALHAAKTARHLVVYEMRRNLNSDASNLNFMARSFSTMHSMFFGSRNETFGKRNEESEMRKNTSDLRENSLDSVRGDILYKA